MEKLQKERSQLRRLFTRGYNDFSSKLTAERTEAQSEQLVIDYDYLADKAAKLFDIDVRIQSILTEPYDFDEAAYEREIDEADLYNKKWIEVKSKFERLNVNLSAEDDRQSIASSNHYRSARAQNDNASMLQRKVKNMKLPKLELRTFDDDPKTWIPFWGQFRKIHEDGQLSAEDKFQYLVQAMKQGSSALELIQSFPPSEENYVKAVQQLKNRFARDEILIETYVRELLSLVLCQSKGESMLGLRSLYDKLMTYLQALETLGVTKDKYEAMLYPMVESALPENILVAWSRCTNSESRGSDLLTNLLNFIKKEVECEERIRISRVGFNMGASSSLYSDNQAITSNDPPTAATFVSKEVKDKKDVPKTYEKGTEFCYLSGKNNHHTLVCFQGTKMTLEQKREAIKNNGGCYIVTLKGEINN